MQTWKSSTLIVVAAFSVSVVLLFTKADMMRERASAGRPLITNHIYSPAAADPDLRNPDHAARLTRREAPATRAVVVRQPEVKAERAATTEPRPNSATLTASARTPSQPVAAEKEFKAVEQASAKTSASDYRPPASHRYYIVAGTFDTRDKAERGLADLQRRGLNQSFIGVFDEGKYVSVIARALPREDQARIMLTELKSKYNIEGYIYHKTEE